MTGPVTTEALAERKPTRRTLIQAQARRHYEHVCRLHEMIRTLEAAHQQVTAERDEAQKEASDLQNDWADEVAASCRETERADAAEASLATATSELARLRAEGEAKDRALASLADNETLLLRAANLIDCGTAKHCEYFFHSKRVSGRYVPAQCARETEEGRGCLADDATSLRILSGKLREATALARAATVREGA